jgi:hypothetical protein
LKPFSPTALVKVLIKPIPIMPVTMAMPMVLSPKMLPSTIRKAAAKHRETPKANSARCHVLMCFFSFYTSLAISNFMLYIFNTKLDKYHIKYLSFPVDKTKIAKAPSSTVETTEKS